MPRRSDDSGTAKVSNVMSSATSHVRGFVIRKSKLGESDLIITLLSEDGSLLRAVAKGARKPKNTFAGRLELFAEANLLSVTGKNLDIISEVSFIAGHGSLRDDIIRSAAASCVCELVGHIAQEDLPNARLYPLLSAFLATLESGREEVSGLLSAAALLKAMAVSGFRPNVSSCTLCGTDCLAESIDDSSSKDAPYLHGTVSYSYADGGPVCSSCSSLASSVRLPRELLLWVDSLLRRPFREIASDEADENVSVALLQFADAFIQAHLGTRLKSLGYFVSVTIPLIFPCTSVNSPLE